MVRALQPKELQALAAKEVLDIIDVREPREWATGHVPGARLVPLEQLREDPAQAVPRDDVVFVCQRGARSLTAAKVAEKLGRVHVYSLDGGTAGWAKAGLPIVVPEPAPRRAGSGTTIGRPALAHAAVPPSRL